MSGLSLHLYKENFKFSCAHFLIFDENHAEQLHGHNYVVRVDLQLPVLDPQKGYFLDFRIFKDFIRQQMETWDEHVLLPGKNPEFRFEKKKVPGCQPVLEAYFRDRYYAFPEKEVILLPCVNTSVEMFSEMLAAIFLNEFAKYGVQKLKVTVQETRGQSASASVTSKSRSPRT